MIQLNPTQIQYPKVFTWSPRFRVHARRRLYPPPRFSDVEAACCAVDLRRYPPHTTTSSVVPRCHDHRLRSDNPKGLPRAGQMSLRQEQASATTLAAASCDISAILVLLPQKLLRQGFSSGGLRRCEAHGGPAVSLTVGDQRG